MKRKKLHKTKTMMLPDSSAGVVESEKETSQNIFTTKVVPKLLKKLLYSAAILLCAAESEQAPRDGRERERETARRAREGDASQPPYSSGAYPEPISEPPETRANLFPSLFIAVTRDHNLYRT
jgi:hypothetical protein